MAEQTRELKESLMNVRNRWMELQRYAEKALTAGNEVDARAFLEKKQELSATQTALQNAYNAASENAKKMRQMHDKLVKDMESLESRAAIKATVKAAKAQERINSVGSSISGANNSMDAFAKMEAKANRMLDEANAMAQLNEWQEMQTLIILLLNIMKHLITVPSDDELAALKAKMGL